MPFSLREAELALATLMVVVTRSMSSKDSELLGGASEGDMLREEAAKNGAVESNGLDINRLQLEITNVELRRAELNK